MLATARPLTYLFVVTACLISCRYSRLDGSTNRVQRMIDIKVRRAGPPGMALAAGLAWFAQVLMPFSRWAPLSAATNASQPCAPHFPDVAAAVQPPRLRHLHLPAQHAGGRAGREPADRRHLHPYDSGGCGERRGSCTGRGSGLAHAAMRGCRVHMPAVWFGPAIAAASRCCSRHLRAFEDF